MNQKDAVKGNTLDPVKAKLLKEQINIKNIPFTKLKYRIRYKKTKKKKKIF